MTIIDATEKRWRWTWDGEGVEYGSFVIHGSHQYVLGVIDIAAHFTGDGEAVTAGKIDLLSFAFRRDQHNVRYDVEAMRFAMARRSRCEVLA